MLLNRGGGAAFSKARSEFPYSRILIQIASLDDSEGQLVTVSDSADSDDALCEKLHENLEKDILSVIIGSYVQGGEKRAVYSVR